MGVEPGMSNIENVDNTRSNTLPYQPPPTTPLRSRRITTLLSLVLLLGLSPLLSRRFDLKYLTAVKTYLRLNNDYANPNTNHKTLIENYNSTD